LVRIALSLRRCSAVPAALGPANNTHLRWTAVLTIVSPEPGATISGPMRHVRLRAICADHRPELHAS